MSIGHPKPDKKTKKSNRIPPEIVKAVFERDGFFCQKCGIKTAGFEEGSLLLSSHCHHKKLKSQGGTDTLDNLETNCWLCHYSEHC